MHRESFVGPASIRNRSAVNIDRRAGTGEVDI
jgi:hypothetical protein